MNEYIKKGDAVDVIVKYPYNIAGKTATAIKMIEDLPSADVVPKSEVDKLQNELVIWKQNRFNLFQRLECYEMARQKVASEIFAEIEFDIHQLMFERDETRAIAIEGIIAELKKKYTE